MMKNFREFALQGNALELLVGIFVWNYGGTIVDSLINDLILPPASLLLGNVDFSNTFLTLKEGLSPGPYASLEAATQAGAVTLNLGRFLNHIASFAVLLFVLCTSIKYINKLRGFLSDKEISGKKRKCAECDAMLSVQAERCPHCNSSNS